MRDRYLFIRILEACNADCFMCEFALSRDSYRFSSDEFAALLPEIHELGVRYVRFTGGEPLMHPDIRKLVVIGYTAALRMSIITNGSLLAGMAPDLVADGLSQIVVSIDGATSTSHDQIRNTDGLFDRAIAGLLACRSLGIRTRVNSVVGPHNYREMPELKRILEAHGVEQWELSALKLDQVIVYPDPQDVLAVGAQIYSGDGLRPMGKPWFGETAEEQSRYFEMGIPPRASAPVCHVTDDVMYLDAKRWDLMPCSLLPHRLVIHQSRESRAVDRRRSELLPRDFGVTRQYYRDNGPLVCTGCSATASGYSDAVERDGRVEEWTY